MSRRLMGIDDVANARESIEFEVEALLRRLGWKHTSSTPGCQWLWEKKLPDGRVALVDTNTAIRFERTWLAESCICTEEEDGDEHRKTCPARGSR